MHNLLDVTVHSVHTCAPEKFPVTVEAVEAHSTMPNYYRIMLAGVKFIITDEHRKDIIQELVDAPPFPKSDAQVDAEREDAGFAPTMGDVEVFRG